MNELETILEECLDQLEGGESNIDECLARYPEHAAQLTPLLSAATKLAVAREVRPSPAFRARNRTELNIYIQKHPQLKPVSPLFWRFTISLVTMVLAFVATGTAFAQKALPGDSLYSWKLTSENIWREISADPLGTDLILSDRRLDELMAVSGDEARRTRAVQNYEKMLIRFQSPEDVQNQERILSVLRSQHESLIKAGLSIPELDIYFPHENGN